MSAKTKVRLTSSEKKRVVRDWQGVLPEFGVFKPMWLLRRAGPMLVGVHLQVGRGDDQYQPITHVHCLCRPCPSVALTLAQPLRTVRTSAPDYIPASFHAERFQEAATRLTQQATFPLARGTTVDDIVRAYELGLNEPLYRHAAALIVEPACVIAITRGRTAARQYLDSALPRAAQWPREVFDSDGGYDAWSGRTKELVDTPERLAETVENQLDALSVRAMPDTPLG